LGMDAPWCWIVAAHHTTPVTSLTVRQ